MKMFSSFCRNGISLNGVRMISELDKARGDECETSVVEGGEGKLTSLGRDDYSGVLINRPHIFV